MSESKRSMVEEILHREHENEMKQQLIEINLELSVNNYDTFDERLNYRGLSREFVQENRLRGMRRSFQLYKDSHIFQLFDWYRDKEKTKYRVSLACLKPKAAHVITLEWKWLTTAIATAIWSMILIYIGYFTDVTALVRGIEPLHIISAGVLMGTITIISLLLFMYYKHDKHVFSTYQSDTPLIELDTDKPDPYTFDQMKQSITNAIAKSIMYKDTQELLIIELKELRRLRDEGVILVSDYEAARQQIFSHREYQAES